MGRASQALLFGLRRLTSEDDSLTDRELLARFAAGRDEGSFAALVRRHGPMVFATCRRALPCEQDAEDVFQAVFLVLARKAGGHWRDGVGAWLHEVARRLTAEFCSRDAARRRRERAAARPEREETKDHSLAALDEELARLPADERDAVILCHLEGRPREQAARLLGLSLRTFERRLAFGMDRLRGRLGARGAAPTLPRAGPLPVSTTDVTRSAVEFAAGSAASAAPAVALAHAFLKGAGMSRLKVAALFLALTLTGIGTWSLSPRQDAPASAAPAPTWREGHRFAPIDPDWRVEVCLLKPWKDDPPGSYQMVALKDRDKQFNGYLTQKSYYEKGKEHPRRVLRYHPSGRLAAEIDNVGKDQYSRSWHLDGSKAGRLHWRDGKWLDGESVSPDGKQRHRLVRGEGELVTYGRKAGNRVHRWYAKSSNILDKHYLDGQFVRVRLNGNGGDWLIVTETEEQLLEKKGIWTRSNGRAQWQAWEDDGSKWGRRQPPPRPYEKARASFVSGYGAILKDAGLSWDKLGIDFIRADKAWPRAGR
jgi:RNA polymerase sigma factor (sigma-70 family)